jgi:hypothetical protein
LADEATPVEIRVVTIGWTCTVLGGEWSGRWKRAAAPSPRGRLDCAIFFSLPHGGRRQELQQWQSGLIRGEDKVVESLWLNKSIATTAFTTTAFSAFTAFTATFSAATFAATTPISRRPRLCLHPHPHHRCRHRRCATAFARAAEPAAALAAAATLAVAALAAATCVGTATHHKTATFPRCVSASSWKWL